ncbi:hypothetical protein Ahy_B03g066341 [Arachis hypogaea]|uniref:Uncharacterized protein n=1 Tax=Arachis hypogaea TaxID=3818 RepID=A0A445A3U2_ARAHY|nr:hypothetical protein Ahy_B03g066341 [Arachis hypogaea]
MHERTSFSNTGKEDNNLDGVKNYNIRRSAEYRVNESDRLKYHVQYRQAANGCQWSLRVSLQQNLGYW